MSTGSISLIVLAILIALLTCARSQADRHGTSILVTPIFLGMNLVIAAIVLIVVVVALSR